MSRAIGSVLLCFHCRFEGPSSQMGTHDGEIELPDARKTYSEESPATPSRRAHTCRNKADCDYTIVQTSDD
ncbi:hypothetical protein DOTSEDRAFT_67433 [Dothistroma septosporum NZE10]|uniref:Uncharacterized protein n=1 Tax=Dothistroma septosporum (strain NZE10 / CBS 128990) TaxID=675120 RepID=N1PZC5_DOTSN|nr:hypothetical protein DOTSEDRAFT_67433 [Dothistroma septosporum NZE10]